ncbi:DUF3307 domain-containing protein [Burkholderia multivorans]|uniref:DUF3307 domain-containing protein n=1 Tax=Burkholderia multivorans TaxID=87883 RepID=UPI001904332E|nr:DUF3307 domain-containing protein [Burkholderia multivorans]MBJ9624568.1 DUF3307 domain-containing protein [Burkholderia multivorans]
MSLFFAMLIGHALADYPLQGDFLARAKNHRAPIPGAPWYQALGAHALIHAGTVWAITGVWWMGVMELAAHGLIDYAKCDGKIDFNTDQIFHVVCKLSYVLIAWSLT